MVTCYPKSECPEAKLDPHTTLQAVNKATIKTYGTKLIEIKIGRKRYMHEAIIADVSQQVIGWDFLRKHNISLLWTEFCDLQLWDWKANIRADLIIKANVTGKWPNLTGYKVIRTNAMDGLEVAGNAQCYTVPTTLPQVQNISRMVADS